MARQNGRHESLAQRIRKPPMKKILIALSGLVPFLSSVALAADNTIQPVADAYVVQSQPTTSFGTGTNLFVKTNASNLNIDALLKFDLTGIGPVASATLRLNAKVNFAPASDLTIYELSDTNWSETAVNWNNRPALGAMIRGTDLTTTFTWHEFDVSAYVRSNQSAGAQLLSFGLHQTNAAASTDYVNSRDSAFPPELVIVTNRYISPLADAHVQSSTPTANYGSATNLEVKTHSTDPSRHSYLKFSLDGIGAISNATLRVNGHLYITAGNGVAHLRSYPVSDTNWTESGINWNNKPGMGSLIEEKVVNTNAWAWHKLDVSSYLRAEQYAGRSIVTLGLQASNYSRVIYLQSRDAAANQPRLVIVTNIPPTNTWIFVPSNGSTVSCPGLIISAMAGDPDGTVTNVAFYCGSMLLGNSTNVPFSLTTSVVGGVHALRAVAYDNLGLTFTSAPVNVTVINVADLNTNNVPDLLEDVALSSPVPFANSPFIVTGAFEAEQFDAGGIGVGYSNVVSHSTNVYRVTGMDIRPCDDLGGGYKLRLQAGEWARYTFKVQLAGDYVVSARSRGTNGGQFKFIFGSANGISNYQTNAPAISGTNWENLQRVVTLSTGYSSLRVEGITDASGFAADLNYLSVYPAFPLQTFPATTKILGQPPYTNWFEGTNGQSFQTAQSNSTTLQLAVEDIFAAGGGTVQIPAGIYYLAQSSRSDVMSHMTNWDSGPSAENIWCWKTFAVRIASANENDVHTIHNIRFAGTVDATNGTNATLLIAHNRTTTLFVAGWGAPTNIAFENITLKGNPHRKGTNALFEPGWYRNVSWIPTNNPMAAANCLGHVLTNNWHETTNWEYQAVGSLLVLQKMRQLALKHCGFVNAPTVPIYVNYCSDVLVLSNSFRMVNADSETNLFFANYLNLTGAVTNRLNWYPLPNNDGVTWNGAIPGPAILGNATTNLVLLNNLYDGNPGHQPNTNGEVALSDGFVMQASGGGNWYLAENEVNRYGIEGAYFHSGPNGVVGNRFSTIRLACVAIAHAADVPGVAGDIFDHSTSIVGNSFVNVRVALFLQNGTIAHFCGNYVSNNPPTLPPTNVFNCEPDSLLVGASPQCNYLNMSGNTASNAGYGFSSQGDIPLRNLFLLANDLRDIHRADLSTLPWLGFRSKGTIRLESFRVGDLLTNAIVARNLLGSGSGGDGNFPSHLSVDAPNAPQIYLFGNTYFTNNVSSPLVTDPTNAPAKVY
jgi:hypothetical protein